MRHPSESTGARMELKPKMHLISLAQFNLIKQQEKGYGIARYV